MSVYKERYDKIITRMHEIDDLCKKENRSRNDSEMKEWNDLLIEKDVLKREIDCINQVTVKANDSDALDEIVRRSINDKEQIVVTLKRDVQTVPTVTPIIPVTISDIIEPLEKGLILNKVGLKMQTGLVGEYNYPIVAAVEAELADEDVELTDKKIDITKLTPVPKRVGICIPAMNFALQQTQGKALSIINQQMPLAVQRVLNKWMFQTTAIKDGCSGCFVAPAISKTFIAALPTFSDLMGLVGDVYASGIVEMSTACFVMGAKMFYALKAKPKDDGSGIFIIDDNNRIGGIPVFVTEYIGAGNIGFGEFNYELFGQFGQIELIIDPYTASKKQQTNFVLNSWYSMTTARAEAFALGKVTA